jgi:hypothetical protein
MKKDVMSVNDSRECDGLCYHHETKCVFAVDTLIDKFFVSLLNDRGEKKFL